MSAGPAMEVSFVVPLHNTGEVLYRLLDAFRALKMAETWELVLVDDGSRDGTFAEARRLLEDFPVPATLVELARNFGEHAAVLEAFRRSCGRYVVNLDDDLQNPLPEALRLLQHLRSTGAEVVYASYDDKRHHWLRNLGSGVVNGFATLLMGKPRGLYLSSFRALRRELVERIVAYRGPYPYIDGLILGATNQIETLKVTHLERAGGRSGYTARKLTRLALSILFNFSAMPLRLVGVFGLLLCGIGGVFLASTLFSSSATGSWRGDCGPWPGVMALFTGLQLLMLAIVGEYVGRAFLTVSGRPQSLVRSIVRHGHCETSAT